MTFDIILDVKRYFQCVLGSAFLFLGGVQDVWADSVAQYKGVLSATSASNRASGADCYGGTNLPSRGNPTIDPYGTFKEYEDVCKGEDYIQCLFRQFKIKK